MVTTLAPANRCWSRLMVLPGAMVLARQAVVGLEGLAAIGSNWSRGRRASKAAFCGGITAAIQYLSVMPTQPPVEEKVSGGLSSLKSV